MAQDASLREHETCYIVKECNQANRRIRSKHNRLLTHTLHTTTECYYLGMIFNSMPFILSAYYTEIFSSP